MQFDYENWLFEVDTFKEAFADPSSTPEVLGFCVRGMCFVTAHAVQKDPGHKVEVMVGFHECLDLAKARMGLQWFTDNLEVVATHSNANMPT